MRPGERPSGPGNRQERRDTLRNQLASRDGFGDRRDGFQDRRDDFPDRRDDFQDRRDDFQDRRDDFPDRRDDIREDWHDRYDDFYDRHDNWHHGWWAGHGGDWWHHMWDDHTALMAFGTTMWGLNWAAYTFGYWGYANPYYTEPYVVGGDVVIDYSQPIVVESAVTTAPPSDVPAPGVADFDAARQAFYDGDFDTALALTDKALAALPNDPIIHEFRALVMFAQGKYREAAAGLHSVLAVGPGWDWTTLSSLYPSVEVYTTHLRALEAYVRQNPDAADARFVLAYHYVTTGSKDAAGRQLKKLYEQTPGDTVIKELLLMTAGPEAIEIAPPAAPSVALEAPPIDAAELVGRWTARGEQATTFALELAEDGSFRWTYTRAGKPETVEGVYALDGNVLAMEPESGGVMLAEVTRPSDGKFDFELLGAPPGDPGLTFEKLR